MMRTLLINKKRTKIATIISLLIGLGATSLAHAQFKATPTANDKGGSFKYVVPTGSGSDKCPGPYESMAVTFVNKTADATPGHGYAVSYNIYYIVADTREYSGAYAYPETDQGTFPTEREGVADASGEYTLANADWDTSGPIIGHYFAKGARTPIHDWSGGNVGYAFYTHPNTGVPKGILRVMSVHAPSPDSTSNGSNSITVRLPVRSYSLLGFEAVATKTDAPGSQFEDWTHSNFNGYINYTSNPIQIQGISASAKNGSVLNIQAGRNSETLSPVSDWSEGDKGKGFFPLKTYPKKGTVNLRAVDEMIVTVAGSNTSDIYIPRDGRSPSMTHKAVDDTYFSGSDLTIKYLKDKATGQNIVCD